MRNFFRMILDILESTGRDLNNPLRNISGFTDDNPIHCGDDECHDDHGPSKGGVNNG